MPELVLGSLAGLGAFSCLFLPETGQKSLPVTLEDGEEFGKGESFLPCNPCGKSRNLSKTNLVEDE